MAREITADTSSASETLPALQPFAESIHIMTADKFIEEFGHFPQKQTKEGNFFRFAPSPKKPKWGLKRPDRQSCKPCNVTAELVFHSRFDKDVLKDDPLRSRVQPVSGPPAVAWVDGDFTIAEPIVIGISPDKVITQIESYDNCSSANRIQVRQNVVNVMASELARVHYDIGAVYDWKQDGYVMLLDGTEVRGAFIDGSSALILPPIEKLQTMVDTLDELVEYVKFVRELRIPPARASRLGIDLANLERAIKETQQLFTQPAKPRRREQSAQRVTVAITDFLVRYPTYRQRLQNHKVQEQKPPTTKGPFERMLTMLIDGDPGAFYEGDVKNYTSYLKSLEVILDAAERDRSLLTLAEQLQQPDLGGYGKMIAQSIGLADATAQSILPASGKSLLTLESYIPEDIIRLSLRRSITSLTDWIRRSLPQYISPGSSINNAPPPPNFGRAWYLAVSEEMNGDWKRMLEATEQLMGPIRAEIDVSQYLQHTEAIEQIMAQRISLMAKLKLDNGKWSVKETHDKLTRSDRDLAWHCSQLLRLKQDTT